MRERDRADQIQTPPHICQNDGTIRHRWAGGYVRQIFDILEILGIRECFSPCNKMSQNVYGIAIKCNQSDPLFSVVGKASVAINYLCENKVRPFMFVFMYFVRFSLGLP